MSRENPRILHLIGSFASEIGGPVFGILNFHYALKEIGCDTEVLTLDSPSHPAVVGAPLKVYGVGVSSKAYGILRRIIPIMRYNYSPNYKRWLKSNLEKYDAVIVDGLWNYNSTGALGELSRQRTPFFVFPHGSLDPWFKKTFPIKYIIKRLSWFFFEGPLLNRASGVLFTAADERDLAQQAFPSTKYKDVILGFGIVDPLGLSEKKVEEPDLMELLPNLKGKKYILYMSRINKKKGCDLLIEAFSKLASVYPDIDLVIAGSDSDKWRVKLVSLAEKLGVDKRVHWPGMLSGATKWDALGSCDVFILPSHQENFGIVLAEALACGKAVITTDKVNIFKEILEYNAGIVSEDSVSGIYEALRYWLALSQREKDVIHASARLCYVGEFDIASVARRLKTLIQEAINDHRAQ